MLDDIMKCETCNIDVHEIETPIIQKPVMFAFRSDIKSLDQNAGNGRTLENICIDCLSRELIKASVGMHNSWKVKDGFDLE